MEDDGFQLVASKSKKGKKKVFANNVRADGSVEDIDRSLSVCCKHVEDSRLLKSLVQQVEEFRGNRRVNRILLMGNGHFDATWEAGCHQLALAMLLAKHFDAQLLFQEPFCTETEEKWLTSQDHICLRKSLDMQVPISEEVEIFIMIHGPHHLVNDFLWFNWSDNLKNLLFVINNYSNINLIGDTIESNKQYEALNHFRDLANNMKLADYSVDPSIFSSTSIMFVAHNVDLPDISKDVPVYSDKHS